MSDSLPLPLRLHHRIELAKALDDWKVMGADERKVLNVVAHIQNMIDELMREHLELMHPTPKPPNTSPTI